MESFNIAIIKLNKFCFDYNGGSVSPDDLKQKIRDYIEFVEISKDNLMEKIVNTIELTPELMGDTSLCYEDRENIIQICSLNPKNNNLPEDKEKINGLSSYLILGRTEVYGQTVVLNSKISDSGICEPVSIDLDTIANLLYKKLFHKGLKVDTDGNVTEFIFSDNPLESMSPEELNNYRYLEHNFLKFNFIIFVQLEPTPDRINKKATRFFGTHRVNGDVIIVSKILENEFSDFDRETFNKLLSVSLGTLSSRKLKESEDKEGEKIDNLPVVYNRFHILNDRLSNTIVCNGCGVGLAENNNFDCTGCYRFKYHSKKCQKDDWTYHKNDCLYNRKPLNALLQKPEK